MQLHSRQSLDAQFSNPWDGVYRVKYGMVPPTYFASMPYYQAWAQNELAYGFQSRLKESVQKEGFRNPILVYHKDILRDVPYGRSRAWLANQLDMPVPAFVVDHNHDPRWDKFEDISTIDGVLSKFKDLPAVVEFQRGRFTFWGCDHVHLTDKNQVPFRDRQHRHNANRLTGPRTLERRFLWWYRDIPSASAA